MWDLWCRCEGERGAWSDSSGDAIVHLYITTKAQNQQLVFYYAGDGSFDTCLYETRINAYIKQ
jgi:hypothetical protein